MKGSIRKEPNGAMPTVTKWDPEDERHCAAIHEAGHAVIAYRLGVVAGSVYLDDHDPSSGNTKFPTEWNYRCSLMQIREEFTDCGLECPEPMRAWIEEEVIVNLAGGHAEMEITGRKPEETGSYLPDSDSGDVRMAWDHIDAIADDDQTRVALMGELEVRTETLVKAHRDDIEIVATALLKFGCLSANDLRRLLR